MWLSLLLPTALAASDVTRCTVAVSTPDGERIALTAWGSTEDQARLQAHRVARLAADLHFESTLLAAVTAQGPEEQAPLLAAMERISDSEPLGVPGYGVEGGACTRDRLPGESLLWRATWAAGERESQVRQSPAAALESARRRSCLVPYQAAIGATLDEVAESPPEDRAIIRTMGLDTARGTALECLSRGDPRLFPALEEQASLPRDSRWLECTARNWQGAPLPDGVAWGRDLAEVAEAALTEHVIGARRAAMGQAARAWARAWAEVRDTEVRQAIDRAMDVVPPTPEIAYSTVSCRALTGARTLQWRPGRGTLVHGDSCAAAVSESAFDPLPVGSPAAAGAVRFEMCRARTWYVLPTLREIRGEVSEQMWPYMALGAWGDLSGCDSLCAGTARISAASSEDLGRWPGGPPRSTAVEADASLDAAIAARDLGTLLQLVEPSLRAGLMETFRREGGLFWRIVPELLRTNGHDPVVVWMEVEEGEWLIVSR